MLKLEQLLNKRLAGFMDLQAEFLEAKKRQLVYNQVKQEIQSDFSVQKLDVGRQQDVLDCIVAIRTSKNPKEVKAARRALNIIYREYADARLRDARKWLMAEKKMGRHENVKNLYEDIERDKTKWNPYG